MFGTTTCEPANYQPANGVHAWWSMGISLPYAWSGSTFNPFIKTLAISASRVRDGTEQMIQMLVTSCNHKAGNLWGFHQPTRGLQQDTCVFFELEAIDTRKSLQSEAWPNRLVVKPPSQKTTVCSTKWSFLFPEKTPVLFWERLRKLQNDWTIFTLIVIHMHTYALNKNGTWRSWMFT